VNITTNFIEVDSSTFGDEDFAQLTLGKRDVQERSALMVNASFYVDKEDGTPPQEHPLSLVSIYDPHSDDESPITLYQEDSFKLLKEGSPESDVITSSIKEAILSKLPNYEVLRRQEGSFLNQQRDSAIQRGEDLIQSLEAKVRSISDFLYKGTLNPIHEIETALNELHDNTEDIVRHIKQDLRDFTRINLDELDLVKEVDRIAEFKKKSDKLTATFMAFAEIDNKALKPNEDDSPVYHEELIRGFDLSIGGVPLVLEIDCYGGPNYVTVAAKERRLHMLSDELDEDSVYISTQPYTKSIKESIANHISEICTKLDKLESNDTEDLSSPKRFDFSQKVLNAPERDNETGKVSDDSYYPDDFSFEGVNVSFRIDYQSMNKEEVSNVVIFDDDFESPSSRDDFLERIGFDLENDDVDWDNYSLIANNLENIGIYAVPFESYGSVQGDRVFGIAYMPKEEAVAIHGDLPEADMKKHVFETLNDQIALYDFYHSSAIECSMTFESDDQGLVELLEEEYGFWIQSKASYEEAVDAVKIEITQALAEMEKPNTETRPTSLSM